MPYEEHMHAAEMGSCLGNYKYANITMKSFIHSQNAKKGKFEESHASHN